MIVTAMYPGTFDPITYGHLDIIIRAKKLFDKVFVAVASNTHKHPLFSLEERVMFVKQATDMLNNIKVFGFDDLTIHCMREKKVRFLIRGLRSTVDLEYEMQLAKMNHYLCPEVETIFMISTDIWSSLSSKLVKEIARYGGRIDCFIPAFIVKRVMDKICNISRENITSL